MKVIRIEEDSHGFIGLANNFKSAVDFLIKKDWITGVSDYYDEEEDTYYKLEKRFGDNWEQEIRNMDRTTFEQLFDGWIYLRDEEIYKA